MEGPGHEQVTRLLAAIDSGDRQAASDLLPLVYAELRDLAQHKLAQEPSGHTLQATALVHEAYLRLLGEDEPKWDNHRHFFAAAAEAMRRILIERARRRKRIKHGGGRQRLRLDDVVPASDESSVDLLALDDALERLEAFDARKSKIVKLRYFAGLTIEETAAALDVSPATVKSDWQFARAWLHRDLGRGAAADPGRPSTDSSRSAGERRMN
jgi:RNA polymerase sigma factor (TIGR02999 family)